VNVGEGVSALSGGWWSVLYPLGGSRNAFVGGGSRRVAHRSRRDRSLACDAWEAVTYSDRAGARRRERMWAIGVYKGETM